VAAKEKKIELSELFVAFEDLEDPRSSINPNLKSPFWGSGK
jgi:hypothetical protein